MTRPALLFLFCAQFPLLDLALRGGRAVEGVATRGAAAATLQSVSLWLVASWLARGRASRASLAARALVALIAGFTLATQALFFLRFAQWIDGQVIRSALADWHDVAPAVRAELPRLAAVTALLAAVELAWLSASVKGLGRPGKWETLAPVLSLVLLVPLASAGKGPPDLRLLAAAAAPLGPSPSRASQGTPQAISLPKLPVHAATLPNVVLIVTESVRADEYCSSPVDTCPTAPRLNTLLPDRIGLPEMRSLASYTAVSMAVLSTGRTQDIPRAELMASPTIFDAMKAIDAGGPPPFTAFWSSHYAPVFHLETPERDIDSTTYHETFFGPEDGDDGDVRLAEHTIRRLPELPSPFFLVLHFHDTHLLYSFDEREAPFTPWTRKVRWETMPELRNAYRNAIHFQDRQVARVMEALRADARWPRTFVLFTSDHGESFGENGQIHHGQDLLDEQIHVPGWVTFGPQVLREDQERALRENAPKMLTHLDVAPTILDLFGVLGAYGLAPHVRKMGGQSLLRPMNPPQAAAITNCTEEFTCPWSTWGLLRGDTKLEAQPWDPGWRCHHLGGGREVQIGLAEEGCRELVALSRGRFPKLPNGADNRD